MLCMSFANQGNSGNEIVFPAGIMQGPVFYGPDVPQYLTYGAFAAVAGQ